MTAFKNFLTTVALNLTYWGCFALLARRLATLTELQSVAEIQVFITTAFPLLMSAFSVLLAIPLASYANRNRFLGLDALVNYSAVVLLLLIPYGHELTLFPSVIGFWTLGLLSAKTLLCIRTAVTGTLDVHNRRHNAWVFGLFSLALTGPCLWSWSVATSTGDEPHYLMTTHSLLTDGDVNLWDEYEQQIYKRFYHAKLEPKPSDLVESAEIYTHGLGVFFPLLLMPGYALGGRLGAMLTIVAMAAALATLCYRHYRLRSPEQPTVWFTLGILFFNLPLGLLSHEIYPDVPAALFIMLSYGYLHEIKERNLIGKDRRWRVEMIGFLVAILSLLRFRYVPIGIFLLITLIYLLARSKRQVVIGAAAVGLALLGYLAVDKLLLGGELFFSRFGKFYQLRTFLPGMHSVYSILGLLIGQEEGMFPLAPGLLLMFIALRNRTIRDPIPLALTSFYLFSLSGHRTWHSLPTTPLRYLAPILPVLGVYLVGGVSQLCASRRLQGFHLVTACFVIGLAMNFGAVLVPDWRVNLADGTNAMMESISKVLSLNATRWLPSFTRLSWPTVLYAGAVLVIIVSLVRVRVARWARLLTYGLAGCSFLLVTQRCWWDAGDPWCTLFEVEDSIAVQQIGGVSYPYPKDPFFHEERLLGWTISPRQQVIMTLPQARIDDLWELKIKTFAADATVVAQFQVRKALPVDFSVRGAQWNSYYVRGMQQAHDLQATITCRDGTALAIEKVIVWRTHPLVSRLYFYLGRGWTSLGLDAYAQEFLRRGFLHWQPAQSSAPAWSKYPQAQAYLEFLCQDEPGLPILERALAIIPLDDVAHALALTETVVNLEQHYDVSAPLTLALNLNPDAVVDCLYAQNSTFVEFLIRYQECFRDRESEIVAFCLSHHESDTALAYVRELMRLRPHTPALHTLAAWSYLAGGNSFKARYHAYQAVKQQQSLPEVRRTCRQMGRSSKALEDLAWDQRARPAGSLSQMK